MTTVPNNINETFQNKIYESNEKCIYVLSHGIKLVKINQLVCPMKVKQKMTVIFWDSIFRKYTLKNI